MSEKQKGKKLLVAAFAWLVILAIGAATYRFAIQPYFSDRLEDDTGSKGHYDHTIRVALDSFSGYAVLRSPILQDELKSQRIRLDFNDDGADYTERLKALKSGDADLAVFTIDSFISAGAVLGEFPASIILIIDETRGADAVVAYTEGIESIQALDDPDARIVLTPNSPSEFLARVVLAQFSLPSLPENWSVAADGADKVYRQFRRAKKTDKRAYVLWEPYVSQALNIEGTHVLLDSSQLEGYIVDVLVANRVFLREQPELVSTVVESYLRAVYSYRRRGAMNDLVRSDARNFGGEKLSAEQSKAIADGVHWKNTLENFAHFDLGNGNESPGIQLLEDMIGNITSVLITTGALSTDPVQGRANTLYYDQILRELQASDFHPSRKLNIIQGATPTELETVAVAEALPALSADQWSRLVSVGELRVKPINFGRGGARINVQSRREIEALSARLRSFPNYYVLVVGHARAQGDPEANLRLAEQRAEAAAAALREAGIQNERMRARADTPSATGAAAQSVSFIVGQPPY